MRTVSFFLGLVFSLLAAQALAEGWRSASSIVASAQPQAGVETYADAAGGRFSIEKKDVASDVAGALEASGVADMVDATVLSPLDARLYQSRVPVTLKLHALSVAPERGVWQAEAYVLSEGKTQSVIPVSGRYQMMQKIPVLVHAMGNRDVIEASDLDSVVVPERSLRKDTVRDPSALIGLSPRGNISAGRPIRLSEISKPQIISKKSQVEMLYTTEHMSIRSIGMALENGAVGDLIRVQNTDTERAVTARVVGANKVEVNLSQPM